MRQQWSYLFRFLRSNGAFTSLNVAGLAFGFACAMLIMLHVRKENTYNSKIPDSGRVFYLVQKTPESPLGNTTISYALTPMLAAHFPEIEYFARTENYSSFSNCIVSRPSPDGSDILSLNEPSFVLADSNLFRVIGYPFVEGAPEKALRDPGSIVLSTESAKKYFGDEPALGQTLVLNRDKIFHVTGVVDIPTYVTFQFSMVAPITSLRSESKLNGWDSNGQPLFKLNSKVDYKEFNQRLEHFYRDIAFEAVDDPGHTTLSLLPVTERRLYYNKNPLYLLIFTGLVILCVSILNYVNLSTSLVQKRVSEIALKKISGAGRWSIGGQFMTETLLVCFVAVLIGGLLAYVGMPLFQRLTGSDVAPFMDTHIGLFLKRGVGLWLLVSLLAGFYPAIILSGIQPLTLIGKTKKFTKGIRGKNVVITFQFLISIILVIFTLMVNRQYRFMAKMPLGFTNRMIVQVPFTDRLKENFAELKDEFSRIPSVMGVCSASAMPAGIPNHSTVSWMDEKGEKREDSFAFAIVSDGYTQTFGMQMASGKEFVGTHPEDLKGVLINEEAARRLGFENPVGQQIDFWGKSNLIIGVVKDFQNNYIFNRVQPMVMSAHPDHQGFTKFLYVRIAPEETDNTLGLMEQAIGAIDPGTPFEYRFTSQEVEEYIFEVKQLSSTFQFASIVSILLAAIGLIALTYQATQARIKEIGVRRVNGARIIEIIHLLNTEFMSSVLIAYVIACPIAWMILNRILQGIDNRTNMPWWIFVLAGLMVGFVALLTVSGHSAHAATRNPVESLRYE